MGGPCHLNRPPQKKMGDQGRVPPRVQILSFSCSFLQKKYKIIGEHIHFKSWHPLRKILDPPLKGRFKVSCTPPGSYPADGPTTVSVVLKVTFKSG